MIFSMGIKWTIKLSPMREIIGLELKEEMIP